MRTFEKVFLQKERIKIYFREYFILPNIFFERATRRIEKNNA